MRTNSKHVTALMDGHIIAFYDGDDAALKDSIRDYLGLSCGSAYHAGRTMAGYGCFLIYHKDIIPFINDHLALNVEHKEYPIEKSWELYKHLCGKAVERYARKNMGVA